MSVKRRAPPLYEAIIEDACERDANLMRLLHGRPFARYYVPGEFWPVVSSESGRAPPDAVLVRQVKPGIRIRTPLNLVTVGGLPGRIDWSGVRGMDVSDELYVDACRSCGVTPGPLRPDDDRIWGVPAPLPACGHE
jgi:hypothetical protein